jgi:hypothetical protein
MPHVNRRPAAYILLLATLALTTSGAAKSHRPHPQTASCPENRDKLYPRRATLERFANILNASIPEFGRVMGFKFEVLGGETQSFGVYDLTDPSNADTDDTGACIELIDGHVYHVVPGLNDFSFSHIIILEGGQLKVFRSINCRGRGDKLEDLIGYLNLKLAGQKNKDNVIGRVKDYRKYGSYARMDNFSSLRCDSADDQD